MAKDKEDIEKIIKEKLEEVIFYCEDIGDIIGISTEKGTLLCNKEVFLKALNKHLNNG